MKFNFINWLNYLLVANIFLIFLGFAWFSIAVIGNLFNLTLGLKLWYRLWNVLFQPAIGILFISILINWLTQKFFILFRALSSKGKNS